MTCYVCPATLNEAATVLAQQPGTLLAGGTDLYPAWLNSPAKGIVIDISQLQELRGITRTDTELRIGGLTTWSEVLAADLPICCDGLKSAAREIGGVQIQNRGTVGGNLCNASPAADSVPPLLTLNVEVELFSSSGLRRLALGDFIRGNRQTARRPDEILTAVVVPRSIESATSIFLKLGARRYLVISIVMVAVALQVDQQGIIEDVRIAVGACSARAKRLNELERALTGQSAKPEIGSHVREDHFHALAPIDDIRATAAYRWDAARTLVERALRACVGNR